MISIVVWSVHNLCLIKKHPEEIVAMIKGDFQENEMEYKENTDSTLSTELSEVFLSQRERARQLITSKKISFDPSLRTFTILGTSDKPHAVRLFPNETCTCPSTSQCYHILAAKMSIGLDDDGKAPKQKSILLNSEKMHVVDERKNQDAKFPGLVSHVDVDVLPAPDPIIDTHFPSNVSNSGT